MKPPLERIARGLRRVTVPFPYLAGLAAAARVELDERVPTMGVFASGRMVANPGFVAKLDDADLLFVIAHELLHLALRTHDRARGSDRLQFNFAHDYIINDILRAALGRDSIPAGGLDMPGARKRSAEEILLDLKRRDGRPPAPREGSLDADVLDAALERAMFPGDAARQAAAEKAVREIAARGLGLARAMDALRGARGSDAGTTEQTVDALRAVYRPRWELALERWIEATAPAERTYARASRRGAGEDVVLAGRRRAGWMVNIVLDASGSMTEVLPRALGAIGAFCAAAAVDQVRLLQCDATVTADELVEPAALARHRIAGFGGSDLTPALERLAADASVRAALVITDGDVAFPAQALPFEVLWVLVAPNPSFRPAYGRVLPMEVPA